MSSKVENIFESFSEVLNSVISGRGKNQSYLVKMTGKDKKQISDYINENTVPYPKTQLEIADSLGIIMEHTDDGRIKVFDPYGKNRPSIEQIMKEREGQSDLSEQPNNLNETGTTLNKANTVYFNTFGKALKHLLEKRGLKQKWLVERTGKGADEMSRYVNSKVEPNYETQELLGDLLDVKFEQHPNGKYSYSPLSTESKVSRALEVDLPEETNISVDHMKALLEQIESIARILKDSL